MRAFLCFKLFVASSRPFSVSFEVACVFFSFIQRNFISYYTTDVRVVCTMLKCNSFASGPYQPNGM